MSNSSMDTFCRSCLNISEPTEMVPLFTGKHTLADKIMDFTSVQISLNDKLPQSICSKCADIVNAAHHFKHRCEKLDEEFRWQLAQFNNIDALFVAMKSQQVPPDKKRNTSHITSTKNTSLVPFHKLDSEEDGNMPTVKHEILEQENQDEKGGVFNPHSFDESIFETTGNSEAQVYDDIKPTMLVENLISMVKCEYTDISEGNSFQNSSSVAMNSNELDRDTKIPKQKKAGKTKKNQSVKNHFKGLKKDVKKENPILKQHRHDVMCKHCNRKILKKHEERHFVFHRDFPGRRFPKTVRVTPLTCEHCGRVFKLSTNRVTERSYRRHVQIMHSADNYITCEICNKKLIECFYKKHLEKHTQPKERKYKCGTIGCGKAYFRSDALKMHVQAVHQNIKLLCEFCNGCFHNKNVLTTHIFYKHPETLKVEKEKTCKKCAKAFAIEGNYVKHISECKCKCNLQCPICQTGYDECQFTEECNKMRLMEKHWLNCGAKRIFIQRSEVERSSVGSSGGARRRTVGVYHTCEICKQETRDLRQHKYKKHSNSGSCQCSQCGKHFAYSHDLKLHLKVHSEPTFACSLCPKKFKLSAGLKNHARIHSDERPFTCKVCDKSFKQSGNLWMHNKLVHSQEKSFGCHLCEKKFALKWSLDDHLRVHTGETRYTCEKCPKSYYFMKALRVHRRTHDR